MPAFLFSVLNTTHDWQYYTEPCAKCNLGLRDEKSYWVRGKTLGGSSAMNVMLYVRGNRQDFDLHWQNAGGKDWNWDSVLPYFEKSRNNPSTKDDATNGMLNIEYAPASEFDLSIKAMLQNWYQELGYQHSDDCYIESFLGFCRHKKLLKQGTRYSAAKGYIRSSLIEQRGNLHIIKMAHVNRLIIDEKTKQVNAVEFVRLPEQRKFLVKVRNEVILSAGAINTPQILMLSGIGPKAELAKYKIPMIQDRAVGENLQDHFMVPLVFSVHKSTAPSPTHQMLAEEYLNYLWHRTGIFSNLGPTDYIGYMNTQNNSQYPDVQVLHFFMPKQSADTLILVLSSMNYKQNIIDQFVAANNEADTIIVLPTLLYPKSHGRITLKSNNPFDAPKIQPNYLQNNDDAKTLVRALKLLRKLEETKTFREHEGTVVRINLELCNGFTRISDEYWDCYMRHMMITVYHPVGTAKMGKSDDSSSVVDAQLNVRGIKGLRIADASM